MTPQQRAKKITIHCEMNYPVGPRNWYSEIEPLIAASIQEAVEEERKAHHSHSYLTARNEAYMEGFTAAKEKASRISYDHAKIKGAHIHKGFLFCVQEVADAIAKLEPEAGEKP